MEDIDFSNPFSVAAHHGHRRAMVLAALVVRTAHQSSDIWAGCRVMRSVSMCEMAEDNGCPHLAGLLDGRFFEGWFDDSHCERLEELRAHARRFLGVE